MIELNQKNLDKLCEDFEKMPYKAGAWWPTVDDINKRLAPFIKEKIAFAIWILETANSPETEEEIASRKLLSRLVYENFEEEEEEDAC